MTKTTARLDLNGFTVARHGYYVYELCRSDLKTGGGCRYIGWSSIPYTRFDQHFGTGVSSPKKVQRDIAKNGESKFTMRLVSCHFTSDSAEAAQDRLIARRRQEGCKLHNIRGYVPRKNMTVWEAKLDKKGTTLARFVRGISEKINLAEPLSYQIVQQWFRGMMPTPSRWRNARYLSWSGVEAILWAIRIELSDFSFNFGCGTT
jgi:hypothetical protein